MNASKFNKIDIFNYKGLVNPTSWDMNFESLLNELRAQAFGIPLDEYERQQKEEQEKIEGLIRKAFEDGTHQFIWEGSISWPAQRALKAAGCQFRAYLQPAPSTEFGGYVVDLLPKFIH